MKRILAFLAVIYFISGLNPYGLADNGSSEHQADNLLRKEISLSGTWEYMADPAGLGEENNYFKPDTDFSGWDNMKVPGNWATEKPDMFSYGGKVWYRRQFKVSEDVLNSKVIHLQFKGVDYFTKVWLNGNYLGEHEGYFTPFDFEVKKYLKPEFNILTVCVDSPKEKDFGKKRLVKGVLINHDCRPPGNDGNTGGIWNEVKLIATGWIYIENALVKPEFSEDFSKVKIDFECLVNNLSSSQKEADLKISFKGKNFSSDITYLKKSVSIQPGESKVVLSATLKNPKLWWTWDHGNPNLYEASISIETDGSASDTEEITFGLRKIKFDQANGFFYLNGRRMFQRGTNYIATQWLSTFKKEDFERDVQMMKDANLNSVRNHAHVMPQEFYTACDEKGLLVWADFALIWGCAEDETFIKEASRQFKEYIIRYYNHPSIWLWCAHNEGEQNTKLNKALYEVGRETDSSRVINENSGSWDRHPYHGWYGGNYENYLTENSKFVSEYGAQGISVAVKDFIPEKAQWPPDKDVWQYHNSQFDFQESRIGSYRFYDSIDEFAEMSLEYQYDVIKFATEHFRRSKYKPTGGAYQFMFTECWPSITWAVIDNDRIPKPAYFALRECMSPVFVSIKWSRRFFSPGDSMEASLWCVNDYLYPISNCTLYYEITDADGRIFYQKETIKVKLEEDSSKMVKDIQFTIPAQVKPADIFRLLVKLEDAKGKVLSANRFIFRVKEENRFIKDLSGAWFFRKGDDSSYARAGFNADWSEIKVPGSWEGSIGAYNGFGWYRKQVNVPKEWVEREINLFIGNIDDSDEVYFNGEKIGASGSLPPNYKSAFNQSRFYAIPKKLIRFGEDNLIAVRVYDFTGDGGLVGGPVEIGDIRHKYIPVYLDYPVMKEKKLLVLR